MKRILQTLLILAVGAGAMKAGELGFQLFRHVHQIQAQVDDHDKKFAAINKNFNAIVAYLNEQAKKSSK